MRKFIRLIESVEMVTLYHGTCAENAKALCENGWRPNSGSQGGNMGQPKYLYLSTLHEDATWFANEKGCDAVLLVTVPKAWLVVDPEDGSTDSVDDEFAFALKSGMPGKFALAHEAGPDSFQPAGTVTEGWYDEEDDHDFDDEDDDEEEEEEEDLGDDIHTTGYNFGKLRHFYNQVVAIADRHMDSGDEIEFDEVASWVEHHRELFQPGAITVYRTMKLDPSFVQNMTPETELGQHWTYEFDADALEGFDINGKGDDAELFVFEAEIDTRDADLPLTVAYNCLFPHEKEIFVTGGVTLKSITEFDFYDGHKEKVRPDLTGKRFGV